LKNKKGIGARTRARRPNKVAAQFTPNYKQGISITSWGRQEAADLVKHLDGEKRKGGRYGGSNDCVRSKRRSAIHSR
jgi:hypothetical protein